MSRIVDCLNDLTRGQLCRRVQNGLRKKCSNDEISENPKSNNYIKSSAYSTITEFVSDHGDVRFVLGTAPFWGPTPDDYIYKAISNLYRIKTACAIDEIKRHDPTDWLEKVIKGIQINLFNSSFISLSVWSRMTFQAFPNQSDSTLSTEDLQGFLIYPLLIGSLYHVFLCFFFSYTIINAIVNFIFRNWTNRRFHFDIKILFLPPLLRYYYTLLRSNHFTSSANPIHSARDANLCHWRE